MTKRKRIAVSVHAALQVPTAAKRVKPTPTNADATTTTTTTPQQRSRKETIHQYHTLLKQLQATKSPSEKQRLQRELDTLGGINEYQQASIQGHKTSKNGAFNTSKWVVQRLQQHNLLRRKAETPATEIADGNDATVATSPPATLQVLDVGSLSNHYLPYCDKYHLHCRAIDLQPQHPTVEELDFFKLNPAAEQHKYDVIVLSLVLNFVPDKQQRGKMLQNSYTMLKPDGGLLYLVLPLACVNNSRYINNERMLQLFSYLGFTVEHVHQSTKLIMYEVKRSAGSEQSRRKDPSLTFKANIAGISRNNFNIALQ